MLLMAMIGGTHSSRTTFSILGLLKLSTSRWATSLSVDYQYHVGYKTSDKIAICPRKCNISNDLRYPYLLLPAASKYRMPFMMANQQNTNCVVTYYAVDNGIRKSPQQGTAYTIDLSVQKGTFSYSVNGL
jgi:hypothetical protein